MEDNKDFQKKLDVILEKRRNCVQLTNEEEAFAQETINKLLDGKKCVRKTVESTTGEQLRKGAFEGDFKSKANVKERTNVTPDPANTPAPIRNANISDHKEESMPFENTSGKVKAEYLKGDNSDTDNKPFEQVNYEEDRVGRYTEHGNPKDSIKVKDVVVKSMPSGKKVIGIVVKVYEPKGGQQALMVKWATGQFEHVNARSVEILKGQKSDKAIKEEDRKASPPITEAKKAVGTESFNFKPNEPVKVPAGGPSDVPAVKERAPAVSVKKDSFPSEPPQEWLDGVVETMKSLSDLSEEEIIPMAKAAWEEVLKAQGSDTEKAGYPMSSSKIPAKPTTTEMKAPAGVNTTEVRTQKGKN